jgi:hypothetical protein
MNGVIAILLGLTIAAPGIVFLAKLTMEPARMGQGEGLWAGWKVSAFMMALLPVVSGLILLAAGLADLATGFKLRGPALTGGTLMMVFGSAFMFVGAARFIGGEDYLEMLIEARAAAGKPSVRLWPRALDGLVTRAAGVFAIGLGLALYIGGAVALFGSGESD